MLTLYEIFSFLIYYLIFPFAYLFCKAGSRKWKDRLGYFDCHNNKKNREKNIWLHASSIGEVKVLSILANQLRERDDSLNFCVTVMTEAGFQKAGSLRMEKVMTGYLPLDYRSAINRFLERVKPDAAIFIETEIWPNIIVQLGRREIPLFLVNGRLSEKAFGRYRWASSGLRKVLIHYKKIMVQTEIDKERFIDLGANADSIEVLGSLKFDAPMILMASEKKELIRKELSIDKKARILIAGSTRENENDIVLEIYKKLSSEYEDLRLILVPRHLSRLEEISRKAAALDLAVRFYSRESGGSSPAEVIIVDKMGILNDLYAVSDIAFVGGTLVDIGGHNILEPVWTGIPVLYGPSIHNVKDSSEYILENRFGEMVADKDELYQRLHQFFCGQRQYRRKSSDSKEPSRADLTAQNVLNNIPHNGKILAEDNRK